MAVRGSLEDLAQHRPGRSPTSDRYCRASVVTGILECLTESMCLGGRPDGMAWDGSARTYDEVATHVVKEHGKRASRGATSGHRPGALDPLLHRGPLAARERAVWS
jgi:hypothetical protein